MSINLLRTYFLGLLTNSWLVTILNEEQQQYSEGEYCSVSLYESFYRILELVSPSGVRHLGSFTPRKFRIKHYVF